MSQVAFSVRMDSELKEKFKKRKKVPFRGKCIL